MGWYDDDDVLRLSFWVLEYWLCWSGVRSFCFCFGMAVGPGLQKMVIYIGVCFLRDGSGKGVHVRGKMGMYIIEDGGLVVYGFGCT